MTCSFSSADNLIFVTITEKSVIQQITLFFMWNSKIQTQLWSFKFYIYCRTKNVSKAIVETVIG